MPWFGRFVPLRPSRLAGAGAVLAAVLLAAQQGPAALTVDVFERAVPATAIPSRIEIPTPPSTAMALSSARVAPVPSTSAPPVTSPAPRPVATKAAAPAKPRAAAPATPRARAAAAPAPAESLQARADRLLASLRYDWQALGYRVEFLPPHQGWLGLTDPYTNTISIYVRPTHTDRQLLVTLAHELGHAVDFTYSTFPRMAEYLQIRGIAAGTEWLPCAYCDDFASPAGDFAEVFAVWLVGSDDFRSRMAPRPSAGQLAQLTPLFLP